MAKDMNRKNFIKNMGVIALGMPVWVSRSPNSGAINSVENKPSFEGRMRHPGLLNSEDDLRFMKSSVNGPEASPMKIGYNKMLSAKYAKLNYIPKAFRNVRVTGSGSNEMEDHFRADGFAAYAHALNWVITGDHRYRNKSIAILNLWADVCTSVYCPEYRTQPTLEASWALPIWASAAEIIRHYKQGAAGWPNADVKRFESFIIMLSNTLNGPIAKAPNWHASRALARMSAGVFLDDVAVYKKGYAEAVGQIELIQADGKPSENERDFGHCQYNVIATAQCAEVAFNQGDKALYLKRQPKESDTIKPLIFRQSEYFVREMLGNPLPGGVDYGSFNKHSPPYEMVLRRYRYNFGMKMPYTNAFVVKYNRPADIHENHFIGWTTLTHAK